VLNTREKKKIVEQLEEQYGFTGGIAGALFLSTKEKLYLLSPDIAMLDKVEERELRIDKAGLYIGRIENNGIRLSIEGSQLIGPYACKYVLEIDEKHLEQWVRGEDFELSNDEKERISNKEGFFIVKHGKDYLGCASVKKALVKSFVSKDRRLKNLNI
jgi:NOL1/NOP2/fmu family ribosome biogenesis protein